MFTKPTSEGGGEAARYVAKAIVGKIESNLPDGAKEVERKPFNRADRLNLDVAT